MDFILFGIQGSGKGTQGKILSEKFDIPYFETGAELRSLAKEDSALGMKVKKTIESGNLVTNEVVMEIVEHFLNHNINADSIILDGIPRSMKQAETLADLLNRHKRKHIGVHIKLSREMAEKRLINRRVCKACKDVYPMTYKGDNCECGGELVIRTDDNADSIKKRLELFETETMPIIKDWDAEDKIITIDGSMAIEKVTEEMLALLSDHLPSL